jgi:hypothetical protein
MTCRAGQLPQVAGEKVGQDVVGDNPRHAGLAGGGADGETPAEGDADQRDLVQAEVVEHGAHRQVPVRRHRHRAVFERTTLARALERDHLVSVVGDRHEHR